MKSRLCLLFFTFKILFAFSDDKSFTMYLGELGSVEYIYDEELLVRIERLSSSNQLMYTHEYEYNESGTLIAEYLIGKLGKIIYEKEHVTKSPFCLEQCFFDENKNLIKHINNKIVNEYNYNENNELIVFNDVCDYVRDSRGNLIELGGSCFDYDDSDRLISVKKDGLEIVYEYDSLGRRDKKYINGSLFESYFFVGINEPISLICPSKKISG